MTPRFAHRRLTFSPHNAHPQKGADVRALQRAINVVCDWRGWAHIDVDGECGRQTIGVGRQVAESLGILLRVPGLSVYAQHLIRHPGQRTPKQKKRAKKWKAAHRHAKLRVEGNVVKGDGTMREKIVAAAMEAAHLYYTGKRQPVFYSQPGYWTVDHGVTGEPRGARSDCSQWVTAIFHSAGAPDPNQSGYSGGYTGTLGGGGGRYIRASEARPGDYVLYGPGTHHHVELLVGPGNRTVGHGSPPVDFGDAFMMADPHFYRPDGID
jgi:hypothetical protein